jgi:hypothetical protein
MMNLSESNIGPHASASAIAHARLEQAIAAGIQRATPTIRQVLGVQPTDSVVYTPALGFEVGSDARVAMRHFPQRFGGTPPSHDGPALSLHQNAWGQLLGRLGVDKGYADSLRVQGEDAGWRRSLLQRILNDHAGYSEGRLLVRSVDSEARGILSSRFRRLDSRPLLDSFCGAAKAVGAVPYEGVHSDTRSSLSFILPRVIEAFPGEHVVVGLTWRNSDFGNGSFGISSFLLRLLCTNGMIGMSHVKERHIGGELPQDIELSSETYLADTSRAVSLTRDIVRGYLGDGAEKAVSLIRKAHEKETTFEAAWKTIGRQLTKADREAAKIMFESAEDKLLPPGKTMLRFANALSWVANTVEDNPDRKLDLQRAAGQLMGV